MSFKMILSFALILMSIGFVYPKDFCEAFGENQYQIDYGFRRVDKTVNESQVMYLFIDQHFWKLEVTDEQLIFKSLESNESKWFGNYYTMAFEVDLRQTGPTIGLLNEFKDFIEFRTESEEELSEFERVAERMTHFEDKFDPNLVTQTYQWLMPRRNHSRWDSETVGNVAFLQQKSDYSVDFYYCTIDNSMHLSCGSNPLPMHTNAVDLEFITNLKISLEIIAVFPIRPRNFVVLFRESGYFWSYIRWCSTLDKLDKSSCQSDTSVVLIYCPYDWMYLWMKYWLWVAVLIVTLILTIGVIFLTIYFKRSAKNFKGDSSGSLMQTKMEAKELKNSDSDGDSLPKGKGKLPAKPSPVPQKPSPGPKKPSPVPQKPSQQPKKSSPVPQKPSPGPPKPSPALQKPTEKSDLKPKSPKKGSKVRSKLEVTQQN